MKIEDKIIILEHDEDFEFIKLVHHIVKVGYGEIKIKIKHSKPYQIVETKKSILLTRDTLKDNETYGG